MLQNKYDFYCKIVCLGCPGVYQRHNSIPLIKKRYFLTMFLPFFKFCVKNQQNFKMFCRRKIIFYLHNFICLTMFRRRWFIVHHHCFSIRLTQNEARSIWINYFCHFFRSALSMLRDRLTTRYITLLFASIKKTVYRERIGPALSGKWYL